MNFPYFVVVYGDDKDRKFPVHPGSGHLLGRHAESSYRLHDHNIARFHCMINALDGVVTVQDQAGSGGTVVNGNRVASHDLEHGDLIQVGDTVIRYLTREMTDEELARGVRVRTEYDPAAVDRLAELTNASFGHYQLGEPIGRGSAAMVFKATDTEKNREVALKMMQPDYATHEEDRQRFIKAMKATMPMRHPNVVRVYAAGQVEKYLWVAMEYVEGDSLACVLKRTDGNGMPDWKYTFRVALKVGRALAHAHEHHIVHRSLSPASVLVRASDQEWKVEDFMLARACEGGPGKPAVRPGDLVGDVNYMSPERTTGGALPIDHRSDLFSLRATCYAVLTGKPPFQASTVEETVTNVRTEDPDPPRRTNANVPAPFEAVIMKLLAKHPSDRYHTAEELVEELEKLGQTTGVKV